MQKIQLIGDSVTDEFQGTANGFWVNDLRNLRPDIILINIAQSGSGVTQWLPHAAPYGNPYDWKLWDRVRCDCQAHIMLGINSALGIFQPRLTCNEWSAKMGTLLESLLKQTGRVPILSIPHPGTRTEMLYQNLMEEYANEIRWGYWSDYVTKPGIDFTQILTPSDFSPNDVHPNITGQIKISAALSRLL